MTKKNNEEIMHFARDILGCGCPDEVFKKNERGKIYDEMIDIQINRIVVGDTLLIYIVRPERRSLLIKQVPELLAKGREDRDSNEYNRFRLVVASEISNNLKDRTEKKFKDLAGPDEKLHIHFVDDTVVAGL